MAKGIERNGRSTYPDGKFITLHEWLMKTEAWQSLDVFARCVYIELKRRYNSKNNGAITAGLRELAIELNCSIKPIRRALKELQERGFIVAIQKGSFNWKARITEKEKHRATIWLLTEFPQDEPETTRIATKDFKKWKAPKSE